MTWKSSQQSLASVGCFKFSFLLFLPNFCGNESPSESTGTILEYKKRVGKSFHVSAIRITTFYPYLQSLQVLVNQFATNQGKTFSAFDSDAARVWMEDMLGKRQYQQFR